MINAIVCTGLDWSIGKNGKLLYHGKEDMRRFRELTTGGIIIVGHKTFNTFKQKPLPGRTNIVISSEFDEPVGSHELIGSDMEHIIPFLEENRHNDIPIWIVGGESVYEQLLPYTDRVWLTKVIHMWPDADAFFPNLDKMQDEWSIVRATDVNLDTSGIHKYHYQYFIYERNYERR